VALWPVLLVILRALEAAQLGGSPGSHSSSACCQLQLQVLANITMSAGLAPVKGLTLPLMVPAGRR
jgi:cell division protein FtsW (lipid II flippase)